VSDGTDLRAEFLLDPSVTFLNHGSFGACPRPVLERCQEWQLELEPQPVLSLARRQKDLLDEERAAPGVNVGADPDDPRVRSECNAGSGASRATRRRREPPTDAEIERGVREHAQRPRADARVAGADLDSLSERELERLYAGLLDPAALPDEEPRALVGSLLADTQDA
jgi:hypothetical protein